MNEHEFLTQQAKDAHAAMAVTLQRLKHRVRNSADPREWVREHPLAMVATAAAAGFTAVLLAGRENFPDRSQPYRMPKDPQTTTESPDGKLHMAWSIAKALVPLARPLLSVFAAMYAPSPESTQSNGHPSSASPRQTSGPAS